MLRTWLSYIRKRKAMEIVLLRIILSRWRTFAEEVVERRQRKIMAIDHFVYRITLDVILGWRGFIQQQKDLNYQKVAFEAERKMIKERLKSNTLRCNMESRYSKSNSFNRLWYRDKIDLYESKSHLLDIYLMKQKTSEIKGRYTVTNNKGRSSSNHEYYWDNRFSKRTYLPKWIQNEISKRSVPMNFSRRGNCFEKSSLVSKKKAILLPTATSHVNK